MTAKVINFRPKLATQCAAQQAECIAIETCVDIVAKMRAWGAPDAEIAITLRAASVVFGDYALRLERKSAKT